jgi:hypothetical protein
MAMMQFWHASVRLDAHPCWQAVSLQGHAFTQLKKAAQDPPVKLPVL